MASARDIGPDPETGTRVFGVNSLGQPIDGVLPALPAGKEFRTVKWSVRERQRPDVGCPTWLKEVVISESLAGARLGATLAGPDEVPPSSSASSENVEAIVVDTAGVEVSRFMIPHALVAAHKPSAGVGDEPRIAAELWFSHEPFNRDPARTPIVAAEDFCNALAAKQPAAKDPYAHGCGATLGEPVVLQRLDVPPDPGGTLVTERNSNGERTTGGRQFFTTSWAFRRRTGPGGCPFWLTRIVVGETLQGARLGANLALPDEPDPGSSYMSEQMEMIVVDNSGARIDGFIANYGVVAALKPRAPGTPVGAPPTAAELWFSETPFDARLWEVRAAQGLCPPVEP